MDIKILVATHKPYWMPEDDIYYPLHVGKEGKKDIGFQGDNTGDNISDKNASFCELTGIYWAWKNLKADYIGLVHYRRYFTYPSSCQKLEDKQRAILKKSDFEELLSYSDILLPKKRNYYIETVRSQYEHAHNKRDLDEVELVIKELYPEYLGPFKKVMNNKKLHILNMFVMKKNYFDDYCQWLFAIIFELEKRIDISSYTQKEARVFGYLSERLLNVWIEKNNIRYKELDFMFMEQQNWVKKGMRFLKRKFLAK